MSKLTVVMASKQSAWANPGSSCIDEMKFAKARC